jgi:hypothetical protein
MRKPLLIVLALLVLGFLALATFSSDFVERATALYAWVFEGRSTEPPVMQHPRLPPVPKLPREPLVRRAAVESLLRLRPDRRFLLAVAELSGAASAEPRFEGGRWIVTVAGKDVGSVSELPEFGEMLELLRPLAQARIAAENLQGAMPPAGRALRNAEESLPALRAAQKSWSAGPHTRGALHEAAGAAAALAFYTVDIPEVADALRAHALALAALDAAAGNDARGAQALVAAMLDYDRAAEELLRGVPGEDALKAFCSGDGARLEEVAGLREATPADRYVRLRLLVTQGDSEGVARWVEQSPPSERLSTAALGQVARQSDMKAFTMAAFALPLFIGARVEGASVEEPAGPFAAALSAGADSATAALRIGKDADLARRIAAAARKLDPGAAGPLLRSADTADFFLATLATALWRQAEYYEYYQGNRAASQAFAQKLGNQTDPALHEIQVAVAGLAASDARSAYEALAAPSHLGGAAMMRLLNRVAARTEFGSAQFNGTILATGPRFDSRVVGRLRWGQIRHANLLERTAPRKLYESVQRDAPSAHPEMATWLAWFSGDTAALKAIALQKSSPFQNRLTAVNDYVSLAKVGDAEELLRTFADGAPSRFDARLPLIRFLHRAGKLKEARAQAMEWLGKHEESSRGLDAAMMRCEASRQDFEMGRWAEGLEVIEPALPAYPFCALSFAAGHLAMLGRKQEAGQLVQAFLARYGGTESKAEAAWVYWLEGDFAAAAGVLSKGLTGSDFRWIVGQRFAKVFAKKPAAEMKPALQALLTGQVSPWGISELGVDLTARGSFEHAYLVGSVVDLAPPDRYVLVVRSAAALRGWKGAEAAREWLAGQIPNPTPPEVALSLSRYAYRDAFYEDVSNLPEPREPGMADEVWLLRAASLARLGERARPETRASVQAHFASARAGRAFQIGRYLMGQLPEEELLKLVTDDATSCDVPYYAGLKAESDGRTDDAITWYRDSVFCLRDSQTSSRWASDALHHIREKERDTN